MAESDSTLYDCGIIGGGLAGLCLAIQLVKKGHRVVVFEKNVYPFHKVCGEYISKESWDFLEQLGLPLSEMHLPQINELGITSTKGFMLEAPLKLGGFGISRYVLDHQLSILAKQNGVTLVDDCKVNDLKTINGQHEIYTTQGVFYSKIVCGSYGKHTPVFIEESSKNRKPNYIGVKYHIKTKFNENRIELHNFKDGYCGISMIEDGKYCLCYLTTAKNLRDCNNSIQQLEETILFENPFLKKIFKESEFLYEKPITVSQVTFERKESFVNGVFLLGDASGAIAPLCGNGMSMGMRASFLLANLLDDYFKGTRSLNNLKATYNAQWKKNFSLRIIVGYYLQQVFGKNWLTHISLKLLHKTPSILQKIISLTHGKSFRI
jgi:menaquinone-9 beta-reductase